MPVYLWPSALRGRLVVEQKRRTDWKGRVIPAQRRKTIEFRGGRYETHDPAEAAAIEATRPFKRNRIRREGGPAPALAPADQLPSATMADVAAALGRIHAFWGEDPEDGFGAFEMPAVLEDWACPRPN